jgi:hypothetical protein
MRRKKELAEARARITSLETRLEIAKECAKRESERADYWRKRTVALTPPNPKVSGLLREGMKEGKGWTLEPLKSTAPQALTPLKSNPGAAFGKVDLDWDFLVEEAGRHLKMALLRATNTSAPEHDQIHPFTD